MQMVQAAVAFFAVLWYNTRENNDFCVPVRPGRLGTKGGAGMRRMKWLVWLLAVLVCVTVLSGSVLAAGDEVTFMTIHVDAASDGSCRVTATAEVDCGTSPTRIVFPLHSGASNISATGGDYKKQTIDGVKCVVFRSDAGFAGKQTFTCTYDLPCSASEQSDGELFTLALLEKGWDYPIRAIEISLTFPSEITVQPTWNSSYYGDVIDNFLRISIRENTITATATTFLKDHETLSFRMLCPSGFFDLHHQPGKTVAFDRIAFYVLLAAALVYWFLRLRGKPILPKKQQTFSPEATAGELVCQLYSQRPDAAAMLASWGALGYVTIYRNPRGRIILKKQMDMGTERKPAERKLFQAIFAHDPICDAQSIRFRSAYKASAGMLRNGWTQRMFRKKTGSPYLLRALAAAAGFVLGFMIFDVRLPAVAAAAAAVGAVCGALPAGAKCGRFAPAPPSAAPPAVRPRRGGAAAVLRQWREPDRSGAAVHPVTTFLRPDDDLRRPAHAHRPRDRQPAARSADVSAPHGSRHDGAPVPLGRADLLPAAAVCGNSGRWCVVS